MKGKFIKAIMVEPLQKPNVVYIPNELKYLKQLVNQDPYFAENVDIMLLEDGVGVLRNKDGALLDLKGNRKIDNEIIAGRFFIIGINNNGYAISLTDDKITKYYNRFKEVEYYTDFETIDSYWNNLEESLSKEAFG